MSIASERPDPFGGSLAELGRSAQESVNLSTGEPAQDPFVSLSEIPIPELDVDDSFEPLAAWSLGTALVIPPLGVTCGHVALQRIASDGSRGRTLALVGTTLGYMGTAVIVGLSAWLLIGGGGSGPFIDASPSGATTSSSTPSSSTSQDSDDSTAAGSSSPQSSPSSVDVTNDAAPVEDPSVDDSALLGFEGHRVTVEFCTVFNTAFEAKIAQAGSPAIGAPLADAYRGLAAVESPNQGIYQTYLGFVDDPEGFMARPDSSALFKAFENAWRSDTIACGS